MRDYKIQRVCPCVDAYGITTQTFLLTSEPLKDEDHRHKLLTHIDSLIREEEEGTPYENQDERIAELQALRHWVSNLEANWDACVEEVGAGTAKVWGLYMAGSRLAFERNEIQLHQVLGVRTGADGRSGFPLRPTWLS